ncbi:ABC transporter substrate-binding protein [uncultured Xylophilus sp.]|uniref:ABC transporter substrate-binding protein n=1 Tax=uncultured Xylophilus sp. TaxID=296832 RepID=UPI0025E75B1B|nr:ABC transporter substrate-binding protein [uncultured Xylophilus sp.]
MTAADHDGTAERAAADRRAWLQRAASLAGAALLLPTSSRVQAQIGPASDSGVLRLPAAGPAADAPPGLSIAGATDLPAFAPVLRDYQRLHPAVAIRYEEFSTQGLYRRFAGAPPPERPAPTGEVDLLVSSSMDLQVRLVNGGHAQPHASPATAALPAWARWRDEVFGFSYEPMVIACDTRRFGPGRLLGPAPATRQALLALLRDPARPLAGRVGTYDLASSGIGYLAATQDARIDGSAGALLAALADNRALRAPHAAVLLDALEQGGLALAYNVPGAYVQARIDAGAPLVMVLPQDYTLVIARTAVIPRTAPHPEEAKRFLDYLLSPRGQGVLANESRILPIRTDVPGVRHPTGALRPIPLGPGLLVYQDRLKRARFLEAWNAPAAAVQR